MKQLGIPTVENLVHDGITKLAMRYWAPYSENHDPFNEQVIVDIYRNELLGTAFSVRRVMLLEFSQYLERYLWPNYEPASSPLEHVMSMVTVVNEKMRERVPAWQCFSRAPHKFAGFFRRVQELALDAPRCTAVHEQTQVVLFLVHCVNSVEVELVRSQVQKIVSLQIWANLLPEYRARLLSRNATLSTYWRAIEKRDAKLRAEKSPEELEQIWYDRRFLARLIIRFLSLLDEIPVDGPVDEYTVRYCERMLELLIDIECQLPMRRFVNALLDNCQLTTRANLSNLPKKSVQGALFKQLLEMLKFYQRFEIDDLTGEAIAEADMQAEHYSEIISLQKAAFKLLRDELREFYLLNGAAVDTRKALIKHLSTLSESHLYSLACMLKLVPRASAGSSTGADTQCCVLQPSAQLLLEMLVARHERRPSQLQALNEMALYPTETVIWDENLVPYEHYSGADCLALHKLNLQFLTLHDYLLRNFQLFRLESTYQIRSDLEDAILRMKPFPHEQKHGEVVFAGWARFALPLTHFQIVEVTRPRIGEKAPASVRCDVTLTLTNRGDIRAEWHALRKHDVIFLVSLAPKPGVAKYDVREPFKKQIEVQCVRGAEIEGLIGPDGRVIEEWEERPELEGGRRTWRCWLDTNQYRLDMENVAENSTADVYDTFHLVVRREPKSNNFKAVLDTMRTLMNTECVVPNWLHDLVLGYGQPSAAHYKNLSFRESTLDMNDTFLDVHHLRESFPNANLVFTEPDDEELAPPFRLTFKALEKGGDKENNESANKPTTEPDRIIVEPIVRPSRSPYPCEKVRTNSVRFTAAQVEAIKSGTQPGLTMVVGPPGTGKTDVAVQIISNIYHNWPQQRTLIVTHSNQALNQLFEKIMQLDVDERHLLRLGHGEESLETAKDFSRYGRVNFVLAGRLFLLQQVEKLQKALGVGGDLSYTCETAAHFFVYQVKGRWSTFLSEMSAAEKVHPQPGPDIVAKQFPFTQFFHDAPQPLFKGVSFAEDMGVARSCWAHLETMFTQLDEFRAFELLRSGRDRVEYLLVKEARIIAMTCTHAALRRSDLVALGFTYDNILMEEAAQILEIETFIPLLLQNPVDNRNRLKRWILIGDHHQLPPVIQNMAFQKYGNMEQSMFARLVRLGVPTVMLDAQGRARASIASLYDWRYKTLGNLPHVLQRPEFCRANAGFALEYQLVNVEDFNGVGESTPAPYFYQNLAEAEYAVAIFTYMRLLGYPAEKITILTTYNGQKHLIRDVVQRRCGKNPALGLPHKVETVDKYQGQQNDYVILSLVRTKHVGHLRDVRRLVVALSRARLGLYIVARVKLFRNCYELTPAFNILCDRPQQLMLVQDERYPAHRAVTAGTEPFLVRDMEHMVNLVFELHQHAAFMDSSRTDREKPSQDGSQAEKPPVTTIVVDGDSDQMESENTRIDAKGDVDITEAGEIVEPPGAKKGKPIAFETLE